MALVCRKSCEPRRVVFLYFSRRLLHGWPLRATERAARERALGFLAELGIFLTRVGMKTTRPTMLIIEAGGPPAHVYRYNTTYVLSYRAFVSQFGPYGLLRGLLRPNVFPIGAETFPG